MSNAKFLMLNRQVFSECMEHEFSGHLEMITIKHSKRERISLSHSSHFAITPNVGVLSSNLFDRRAKQNCS
jgi:hypothetical protein